MKRRGHHSALANKNGMAGILGKDFNPPPDGFDNRRADENHLEWFLAKFRWPHVNVACELAAVAIPQNSNIKQTKRGLRRPVHFARKQDCSSARAEECAPVRGELLESLEQAFLRHHLQMGAALAARENHSIEMRKIIGAPDVRVRRAKTVERLGVSFVITLNRQYSYLLPVSHSHLSLSTMRNSLIASY